MNRFRQLVCGILGLILAGIAPSSTLAGDWVSLFDGQSLSGWTKVEGRRGGSNWEVVDGVIVGSGQASMLFPTTKNVTCSCAAASFGSA